MKRLIAWIFGRRNKPGGMAWIRGLTADDGRMALNNRAVRTIRRDDRSYWVIDPPQTFYATKNVRYVDAGVTYRAGEPVTVIAIGDEFLEPWKEDGVTDSEVRELFAPRLTKEVIS